MDYSETSVVNRYAAHPKTDTGGTGDNQTLDHSEQHCLLLIHFHDIQHGHSTYFSYTTITDGLGAAAKWVTVFGGILRAGPSNPSVLISFPGSLVLLQVIALFLRQLSCTAFSFRIQRLPQHRTSTSKTKNARPTKIMTKI